MTRGILKEREGTVKKGLNVEKDFKTGEERREFTVQRRVTDDDKRSGMVKMEVSSLGEERGMNDKE